ncbi:cupin domain-containing protein [Novosphingobium sp. BL-52-GroH]|uniref:cupin domain-containing protein n=1 Tax=Novosphingobium sp. BL-52-GroH TaxID=3349877 RepID=UPI00384FFD7D
MTKTVRRIVTGHDSAGKSIFLEDGPSPQFNSASNPRVTYFELWNTAGSPTPISAVEPKEPNDRRLQLPPPSEGTIMRIIDVHPGNHRHMAQRADGRSSHMHRTRTIDYAVCLSGEIYAVLDDSETLMRAGDVLIQRGTDHAWENRSEQDCRMLFILIDGEFTDELKQLLPDMVINVAPPSLKE